MVSASESSLPTVLLARVSEGHLSKDACIATALPAPPPAPRMRVEESENVLLSSSCNALASPGPSVL